MIRCVARRPMNTHTVPPARTLFTPTVAVLAALALPAALIIVTSLAAAPALAAPVPADGDDPPPATLPMQMDVSVNWDVDEGDTVNKGSMTARYRGTLKIDAESSSYTHDMPTTYTTYTAGEVNVTYTYEETRTDKNPPRGCPPLKEQFDGSGSFRLLVVQSPGGSALHVHRVAAFVPKEMLVFVPLEVREMIIDYYNFFALSRDQTVRGKVRNDDCQFEAAEKDIGISQLTLRFKITDDGKMDGERSWSSQRQRGAADLMILLSDLPASMEDKHYEPENDGQGNVSYEVSWAFGEVEPLVEIERKEGPHWIPLGDDPVEVKVGEKIELRGKVLPEEQDTKKGDWTVPGKRVKGFKVEGETGKKDDLKSGDLKETPTVTFYWYDGADGLEVKYAAKTKKGESLEATATFTVQEPELKIQHEIPAGDFVVAKVVWDDDEGQRHMDREFLYDAPGRPYSIRFWCDPPPPEFGGQTQWSQLVSVDGQITREAIARAPCNTISTSGHDEDYPYAGGSEMKDRPGVDSELLDLSIEVMLDFQVSLMYKPDSEGAIFVPIRETNWHWMGVATRPTKNADWDTSASRLQARAGDIEAEDYLEWTNVTRMDDDWGGCE